MQTVNSIDSSVIEGSRDGIKLPPLPVDDINKLDFLLSRMKEKKTEFVNIHSVCKEKWGDNKLLYLFFAEYLKKNYFTTVQSRTNNPEYAWKHMIAPSGLAFKGFKYEYIKQRAEKGKEAQESSTYQFIASFLTHYFFPFCILIAF